MMMTQDQARMTAALIHSLRPDWDERGIVSALGKSVNRADAGLLAVAAIHAAMVPTNKTPAVIAMDGLHWQKAEGTAPAPKRVLAPPSSNDTSPECGNHPGVKSWACKPCRVSARRPANFAEMVLASAEATLAERLASRSAS